MYITRSLKILTCKYTKRKIQYSKGMTRTDNCLVQWFPTFFMSWPTCRFQQNVVAHHHRTIEKSTLNLYSGTNMSKQNKCLTIIRRILFNFSITNTSRLRDKLQCDFCSCVMFSTRLPILGCVVERTHLRSSSRVKLSRCRFFVFTCRRAENPHSHKYVLGKRSTFLRASFPTFG